MLGAQRRKALSPITTDRLGLALDRDLDEVRAPSR